MRKSLAVAAAALTLALAACTNGDAGESTPSTPMTSAPISDAAFVDGLIASDWPPSVRSDPAIFEWGKTKAASICGAIESGIAEGLVGSNRIAAQNGGHLERMSAVFRPSDASFGAKRESLLNFVNYGCPEHAPMVRAYVEYARTQPMIPTRPTSPEFERQPRPEAFEWPMDNLYNVGPFVPDESFIPAGYYLASAQNPSDLAWYVECSHPDCGIGGVTRGATLDGDGARTLIVDSSAVALGFRNVRLTPDATDDRAYVPAAAPQPTTASAPQTTQNAASNGSSYPTNGTIRVGYDAGMIPPGMYEARMSAPGQRANMANWTICGKITCKPDDMIDAGIVTEPGSVAYVEIPDAAAAINLFDTILTPYNG